MFKKNKIISCFAFLFMSNLAMATSITGTTKPYNTLKITSKIEGQIVSYEKEIGEETTNEELLLKIDQEKLIIKKDLAKSNLDKANIDTLHYEKRLDRYEELRLNNNISVADYEDVEYQYLTSKNNIKIESLNLSNAKDDLNNSNIFGKDGYIVSSRYIEIGDYVNPSSLMYELVDVRKLKIEALVGEEDVLNINVGDSVNVNYKDIKIQGKVIQKGFSMKDGFYAYPVIIEIENEQNLTLGLTVNIELGGIQ